MAIASYDKCTDSLYVEVRPLPSARTIEIEEDVMLDIGRDGEPVGYDIQHASMKTEFIARLILCTASKVPRPAPLRRDSGGEGG